MGNTLSIGDELQYAYDVMGRLASATRADRTGSGYSHNAAGQRVLHQTGGFRSLRLYGERGELLGSYDSDGLATQQVIWIAGRPAGMMQDGKLLYIEVDHLGSPRTVIDPARDVSVWSWSLLNEAFGAGAPSEDADQDGVVQGFDLRFPGQEFDAKSGLHYNYFRDYDSTRGRYIQSDPIGLHGGSSTYSYAGSDPLHSTDPFGLVAWRGYAHGIGVSAGVFAFAKYNFHLTSDCINGKMAIVDLDVGFAGGGVGSPATYTISNVSLEDGMSTVDPSNLTGPATMYGAGFSVGGGASFSGFKLGRGYSAPSWAGQGGWDASVYGYPVGYSSYDGSPRIIECGCGL